MCLINEAFVHVHNSSIVFFLQAERAVHLDDEATNADLSLFVHGRDVDCTSSMPVATLKLAPYRAVRHLHPGLSLDSVLCDTAGKYSSNLMLGADEQANACDSHIGDCKTLVCRRVCKVSSFAGCFLEFALLPSIPYIIHLGLANVNIFDDLSHERPQHGSDQCCCESIFPR